MLKEDIGMANGKILRQLIKAGASGDSEAFRRASEAVIQDELGRRRGSWLYPAL